jgi:hypothetical protein
MKQKESKRCAILNGDSYVSHIQSSNPTPESSQTRNFHQLTDLLLFQIFEDIITVCTQSVIFFLLSFTFYSIPAVSPRADLVFINS